MLFLAPETRLWVEARGRQWKDFWQPKRPATPASNGEQIAFESVFRQHMIADKCPEVT
jgi:hypothetical protein